MTQFGTDTIDRVRAREILLGDRFKPKQKDIDTPQILLDAGIPQNSLRLVGFSAREARNISTASNDDQTLYLALCARACVCWRADDQPLFNMADAPVLVEQDVDLLNELAIAFRPFLGIGPKAVEQAKNASPAASQGDGQKSDGGGESPSASDSPLPENVSEPSSTATS